MQPSSPQRDMAAAYMSHEYTEPKSQEGLLSSFATLRKEQMTMQNRISQLADEIVSVRSQQEQAVDGLGGLIEQVSKSMAVVMQRSEDRMQAEMHEMRAELGQTMRVELGQTVTTECRKVVREQLNSALSTCASLVEAMQLKLKQLDSSNLDRRLAQLEVMLLGGSQEQKDTATGGMLRPASWHTGLDHSGNSIAPSGPETASCGPCSDATSTASSVSGKPVSTASSLYSHATSILESLSPADKEKVMARNVQGSSMSFAVGARAVAGTKESTNAILERIMATQQEILEPGNSARDPPGSWSQATRQRDQSPVRPERHQNLQPHPSPQGSQTSR